jgi:GT2 family glycosyltransferase
VVRRELFERLGGFEAWLDHGGGRPFAEDTWFGWRARRAGARAVFCADAVVHHEVFRRSAREFLAERLRLQYFPASARQMPELREHAFFARWFLTRHSAAFDAAVVSATLAAALRSPLALAGAAPYALSLAQRALPWRRRAPQVALVTLAADAAGFAALVRGSIRRRSLLL